MGRSENQRIPEERAGHRGGGGEEGVKEEMQRDRIGETAGQVRAEWGRDAEGSRIEDSEGHLGEVGGEMRLKGSGRSWVE